MCPPGETVAKNQAPLTSVCLLGAGSFGTAVSRIVADNLVRLHLDGKRYDPVLKLWARRPSLADEMNTTRENKKYLPNARLPDNIHVSTDMAKVLKGCQVVIVAIPSNHLSDDILKTLAKHSGHTDQANPSVHFVSLAKGIEFQKGELLLVSDMLLKGIQRTGCGLDKTSFHVSVLMGANVSDQMGRDEFAEATLGCSAPTNKADMLLSIFHDPDRYSVTMTSDVAGVELSGALKNIVALAAGYAEGLDLGSNTKAAIIRRGLKEIIQFAKIFFDNVKDETFLESSGVADLLTTCFGGRGRRLAAAFVQNDQRKTWGELEKELLNGQQIPDWHNVQHVFHFLRDRTMLGHFPLFEAVYCIGFEKQAPYSIVNALKQIETFKQIEADTANPRQSLPCNIAFYGQRALVTGAGNGIGFAVAELLSQCGAKVIALDRDLAALKKMKTKLHCDIIAVDLMDISALEQELEKLASSPPQMIVNCAGIAKFQPFFDTDMATFDATFAVNTRACVFITQMIAKQLSEANLPGSVVHITSQSSTIALRDHLVYSSSKAALDHIARIQALELGKMNIRVNVVRPTVVLTELARQNWKPGDLVAMRDQVPLGRLAQPIDVAKAVCWLLSENAAMITGEAVAVDGGRSMGGCGL